MQHQLCQDCENKSEDNFCSIVEKKPIRLD